MANLANGDILKVRVCTRQLDQNAFNIWHFELGNLVGAMTDSDVAVSFDVSWAGFIKPIVGTIATYQGCGVQRIRPAPAAVEVFSVASAGAGTAAGDSLPQQVAGLVKLGNGLAGKINRAYKYIPYPVEAANDAAGQLGAGYLASLSAFMSSLIPFFTAIGAGGQVDMFPVMSSRVGAPRVTTFANSINWAQQKRRGAHNRPDGTFPPP